MLLCDVRLQLSEHFIYQLKRGVTRFGSGNGMEIPLGGVSIAPLHATITLDDKARLSIAQA